MYKTVLQLLLQRRVQISLWYNPRLGRRLCRFRTGAGRLNQIVQKGLELLPLLRRRSRLVLLEITTVLLRRDRPAPCRHLEPSLPRRHTATHRFAFLKNAEEASGAQEQPRRADQHLLDIVQNTLPLPLKVKRHQRCPKMCHHPLSEKAHTMLTTQSDEPLRASPRVSPRTSLRKAKTQNSTRVAIKRIGGTATYGATIEAEPLWYDFDDDVRQTERRS